MKKLNVILGVLVLAAAAMLASIVAGAASLLMLASGPMPAPARLIHTVQIVRQIEVHPAVKVFELAGGAGVVVFRQVNGKLVSRFYRAQA